ncbi:MAG: hypothetical protein Q7O66_19600 [Dehalococcoidia bacterium]|nr:hypothetical protein [Dehalococcoidia bacterium]
MARQVFKSRANPSNPDLFGEDVVNLALEGTGAAGASLVVNSVINPFVGNLLPLTGDVGNKVKSFIMTAGAAWLIGEGGSLINANVGRRARHGASILAIMQLISIPFPNINLTGQFSTSFLNPPAAPAPKLLPPAGSSETRIPLTPASQSVTGL